MKIEELLKKYEVKDVCELFRFIEWIKEENARKEEIIKDFLKVAVVASDIVSR